MPWSTERRRQQIRFFVGFLAGLAVGIVVGRGPCRDAAAPLPPTAGDSVENRRSVIDDAHAGESASTKGCEEGHGRQPRDAATPTEWEVFPTEPGGDGESADVGAGFFSWTRRSATDRGDGVHDPHTLLLNSFEELAGSTVPDGDALERGWVFNKLFHGGWQRGEHFELAWCRFLDELSEFYGGDASSVIAARDAVRRLVAEYGELARDESSATMGEFGITRSTPFDDPVFMEAWDIRMESYDRLYEAFLHELSEFVPVDHPFWRFLYDSCHAPRP